MNNKLVEEIDDVLHDLDHGNITRGEAKAKLLLAMNAEVEEPLAVLAERKGQKVLAMYRAEKVWVIRTSHPAYCSGFDHSGLTYALAEAKARAYLEAM